MAEQPNDADALELVAKVQPAALRDKALAFAEAGKFAEIPAVLEELEKVDPKSETTETLKAQITQIKAQKEQESADRLARLEQQKAETESRKQKQELESAFATLQKDMPNPNALPSVTWKTSKSLEQVRAAIETMSKSGKEWKSFGPVNVNDRIFMVKFGAGLALLGGLGGGYQTRVLVCDLGLGQTEIRARSYPVSVIEILPSAQADILRSKNQLEKLRSALASQLDGDLK